MLVFYQSWSQHVTDFWFTPARSGHSDRYVGIKVWLTAFTCHWHRLLVHTGSVGSSASESQHGRLNMWEHGLSLQLRFLLRSVNTVIQRKQLNAKKLYIRLDIFRLHLHIFRLVFVLYCNFWWIYYALHKFHHLVMLCYKSVVVHLVYININLFPMFHYIVLNIIYICVCAGFFWHYYMCIICKERTVQSISCDNFLSNPIAVLFAIKSC